jgi:hypothetical protein
LELFLNRLEKLATENNLYDTPRNIFNIDESGLPINNKPDTIVTENGLIKLMFQHLDKRVIACCTAEGQFLPPVLILTDIKEK